MTEMIAMEIFQNSPCLLVTFFMALRWAKHVDKIQLYSLEPLQCFKFLFMIRGSSMLWKVAMSGFLGM